MSVGGGPDGIVTLAATPPLPLRHALHAVAADMLIVLMIERSCDSNQFIVGIKLIFFRRRGPAKNGEKTAKNGEFFFAAARTSENQRKK